MTDAEKALLDMVVGGTFDTDRETTEAFTDAVQRVRCERLPIEVLEAALRKFDVYLAAHRDWMAGASLLQSAGIPMGCPRDLTRKYLIELLEVRRGAR